MKVPRALRLAICFQWKTPAGAACLTLYFALPTSHLILLHIPIYQAPYSNFGTRVANWYKLRTQKNNGLCLVRLSPAAAGEVEEFIVCSGFAAGGGFAVPIGGELGAGRGTGAFLKAFAQFEGGAGMAGQGGALEATAAAGGVARAAEAFQVAFAEPVEGIDQAGAGGGIEPLDGFFKVAAFSPAPDEFLGEVEGGLCITGGSAGSEFLQHGSEFLSAENPGGGEQVQQHVARSDERQPAKQRPAELCPSAGSIGHAEEAEIGQDDGAGLLRPAHGGCGALPCGDGGEEHFLEHADKVGAEAEDDADDSAAGEAGDEEGEGDEHAIAQQGGEHAALGAPAVAGGGHLVEVGLHIGLAVAIGREGGGELGADAAHALGQQQAHDAIQQADHEHKQGEHAQGFAGQVIKTGHGFAEDGVEDAVLGIAREKQRSGGHAENEPEELHAAQAHVLDELELGHALKLYADVALVRDELQAQKQQGHHSRNQKQTHAHQLGERDPSHGSYPPGHVHQILNWRGHAWQVVRYLRAAFSPSSISFQKLRELLSFESSASAPMPLRKRKSLSESACSTRCTTTTSSPSAFFSTVK